MADEQKTKLRLEVAHVLFMDIVGYSKLLIDEQTELLQDLNHVVRETEAVREAEAAGQLIRLPTGDGMALVFTSSAEAPVECAMQISQALRARPNLPLRMGIHSGPVNQVEDVNQRTNIAGAGINIAQRVMDCGDAGHILLSKRVADDLAQYRRWQPYLHSLGDCEVKHGVVVSLVNLYGEETGNRAMPGKLRKQQKEKAAARAATRASIPPPAEKVKKPAKPKPVGVTVPQPSWFSWQKALIGLMLIGAVFAGSLLFLRSRTPSHLEGGASFGKLRTGSATPNGLTGARPSTAERSIAVLPFENLSRDPDNSYFADGIQDEILTRLAKIGSLKVISRTSTQQYATHPSNLPEIARQLNVANILEGSVQKAANQVHINAQLIRAATDEHLWAEVYDRSLDNVFGVEAEVAAAVAQALNAKLSGAEQQALAEKPTDNTAAYDAYLRGLAYSLKAANTVANARAAQNYLKEAVRLDPKFALAWALLSYTDGRGYRTTTLPPTIALREEARQAAETALTLQPDLGEAVLAKGYYHYFCLNDHATALGYFARARQFLPNSSQIPEALAYIARRQGRWDESETYFNEAERLDPRNVTMLNQHAVSYVMLRRFSEGVRKLDQVLNITPDDVDTLAQKAAVAQAEGDLPRAAANLAPLQLDADHSNSFETQIYQAILERRPAPIIPRLVQILTKPDPALGYNIGELRFYLGWAQDVAGDHAAAQESWRQARSELESFLREEPENYVLIDDLALTNMGLRDKAIAFKLIDRAMAVIPMQKDAMNGPTPVEILARVAAQLEEPDRAIVTLQKLLSIPYEGPLAASLPLTPALLRLDPMFDPLRNDSRFQKLIASP
jgi:TolB-like protein/class 3 adenylate cyclase